ncbi:Protein of unknown function [Micromonospora lupini str. Lupac 08]|uniref:Uncharacterized protein n=1 Tax=Micromonospora lupini str. Lupac 08 TaxID=1150864 RepID=I0L6H9_9ACTN|nr:Protein of unknown function [Micromonospora lupini str. Lupac 08]
MSLPAAALAQLLSATGQLTSKAVGEPVPASEGKALTVHGQFVRAAVQVEALSVGGDHPPSLMVASHLTQAGITAYVLDPTRG